MIRGRYLAVIVLILSAISFVACGNSVNNNEDSGDKDRNNLQGTVLITGSTSVEKILNAMIDEFRALHSDVAINYTGSGSSAGISDTLSGSNHIGVSSREVKDEEKHKLLMEAVFAYDGIAVVVNPSNNVQDISIVDLCKIYSGEITNWKELGGLDGEIVVVAREGASGTRNAFEELIQLDNAGGLQLNATVVEGNGNVQLSVANNENAIGYVSFSFINDTIKALKINGVAPTPENSKEGSYLISRPFVFVYRKDNVTPEVEAFIQFALGEEGQSFVEEEGGIRVD